LTDLDWTFVTTGLSDAVAAARDRARDLDVVLMGGGGPPRTLVQRSVTATSTATHLTYQVG